MKHTLHKTALLPTIVFFTTALVLISSTCLADVDEWTWMSGDNETGQLGVYGTKGEPDSDNMPGRGMAAFPGRTKTAICGFSAERDLTAKAT